LGHSHHWRFLATPSVAQWSAIDQEAAQLMSAVPYPLADWLIDDRVLHLDAGAYGVEPLHLERRMTPRWQSCNTERTPCDLLFRGVLAVAQMHCTAMELSSDAALLEWQPVLTWARQVLGHVVFCRLLP
jgi:hypothetical protein